MLVPVATGFLLGCIHAFDVDHVIAVTAFASKQAHTRGAAAYGLVWGLGHATTLVVLGLASLVLKVIIPPMVESIAELGIGGMLIALGVWTLRNVFRRKHIHLHTHSHDGVEHLHFHTHKQGPEHTHKHSMFIIGATHGLAGTAAVMVLLPLAISQSLLASAAYLLLFGMGSVAAMGIFAYLLGKASAIPQARRALPAVQGIAGCVSIATGSVWIGLRLI